MMEMKEKHSFWDKKVTWTTIRECYINLVSSNCLFSSPPAMAIIIHPKVNQQKVQLYWSLFSNIITHLTEPQWMFLNGLVSFGDISAKMSSIDKKLFITQFLLIIVLEIYIVLMTLLRITYWGFLSRVLSHGVNLHIELDGTRLYDTNTINRSKQILLLLSPPTEGYEHDEKNILI